LIATTFPGYKAAGWRIIQELIRAQPTVVPGALRQHGIAYDVEIGLRKITARGGRKRSLIPEEPGKEVSPIVSWRSGNDSIEVSWVSLRLHQGFAAAVRTTHEIGATSATRVEFHDNVFGNVGRLLERSISEIDHLFRVALSPRCVNATALMAIVGPRYRVTSPKRLAHAGVADSSQKPPQPT